MTSLSIMWLLFLLLGTLLGWFLGYYCKQKELESLVNNSYKQGIISTISILSADVEIDDKYLKRNVEDELNSWKEDN